MATTKIVPPLKQLRAHLHARDLEAFLSVFQEPELIEQAKIDDYIKALGGESLCVVMEEVAEPPEHVLLTYQELLLEGLLLVPSSVVLELASRLNSNDLVLLGQRIKLQEERRSRSVHREPRPREFSEALSAPVIEIRRSVQSTYYAFSPQSTIEALGRRRSVFRSEQERSFQKALSLRFPALLALPNYPIDGIAELSCLRKSLGERVWSYARNARIDALLVMPDEGFPVAAFELDSRYHDQPETMQRDEMKDAIFRLLAIPFFRLRIESPNSATCDDWYAILTDEVATRLDLGHRLRPESLV